MFNNNTSVVSTTINFVEKEEKEMINFKTVATDNDILALAPIIFVADDVTITSATSDFENKEEIKMEDIITGELVATAANDGVLVDNGGDSTLFDSAIIYGFEEEKEMSTLEKVATYIGGKKVDNGRINGDTLPWAVAKWFGGSENDIKNRAKAYKGLSAEAILAQLESAKATAQLMSERAAQTKMTTATETEINNSVEATVENAAHNRKRHKHTDVHPIDTSVNGHTRRNIRRCHYNKKHAVAQVKKQLLHKKYIASRNWVKYHTVKETKFYVGDIVSKINEDELKKGYMSSFGFNIQRFAESTEDIVMKMLRSIIDEYGYIDEISWMTIMDVHAKFTIMTASGEVERILTDINLTDDEIDQIVEKFFGEVDSKQQEAKTNTIQPWQKWIGKQLRKFGHWNKITSFSVDIKQPKISTDILQLTIFGENDAVLYSAAIDRMDVAGSKYIHTFNNDNGPHCSFTMEDFIKWSFDNKYICREIDKFVKGENLLNGQIVGKTDESGLQRVKISSPKALRRIEQEVASPVMNITQLNFSFDATKKKKAEKEEAAEDKKASRRRTVASLTTKESSTSKRTQSGYKEQQLNVNKASNRTVIGMPNNFYYNALKARGLIQMANIKLDNSPESVNQVRDYTCYLLEITFQSAYMVPKFYTIDWNLDDYLAGKFTGRFKPIHYFVEEDEYYLVGDEGEFIKFSNPKERLTTEQFEEKKAAAYNSRGYFVYSGEFGTASAGNLKHGSILLPGVLHSAEADKNNKLKVNWAQVIRKEYGDALDIYSREYEKGKHRGYLAMAKASPRLGQGLAPMVRQPNVKINSYATLLSKFNNNDLLDGLTAVDATLEARRKNALIGDRFEVLESAVVGEQIQGRYEATGKDTKRVLSHRQMCLWFAKQVSTFKNKLFFVTEKDFENEDILNAWLDGFDGKGEYAHGIVWSFKTAAERDKAEDIFNKEGVNGLIKAGLAPELFTDLNGTKMKYNPARNWPYPKVLSEAHDHGNTATLSTQIEQTLMSSNTAVALRITLLNAYCDAAEAESKIYENRVCAPKTKDLQARKLRVSSVNETSGEYEFAEETVSFVRKMEEINAYGLKNWHSPAFKRSVSQTLQSLSKRFSKLNILTEGTFCMIQPDVSVFWGGKPVLGIDEKGILHVYGKYGNVSREEYVRLLENKSGLADSDLQSAIEMIDNIDDGCLIVPGTVWFMMANEGSDSDGDKVFILWLLARVFKRYMKEKGIEKLEDINFYDFNVWADDIIMSVRNRFNPSSFMWYIIDEAIWKNDLNRGILFFEKDIVILGKYPNNHSRGIFKLNESYLDSTICVHIDIANEVPDKTPQLDFDISEYDFDGLLSEADVATVELIKNMFCKLASQLGIEHKTLSQKLANTQDAKERKVIADEMKQVWIKLYGVCENTNGTNLMSTGNAIQFRFNDVDDVGKVISAHNPDTDMKVCARKIKELGFENVFEAEQAVKTISEENKKNFLNLMANNIIHYFDVVHGVRYMDTHAQNTKKYERQLNYSEGIQENMETVRVTFEGREKVYEAIQSFLRFLPIDDCIALGEELEAVKRGDAETSIDTAKKPYVMVLFGLFGIAGGNNYRMMSKKEIGVGINWATDEDEESKIAISFGGYLTYKNKAEEDEAMGKISGDASDYYAHYASQDFEEKEAEKAKEGTPYTLDYLSEMKSYKWINANKAEIQNWFNILRLASFTFVERVAQGAIDFEKGHTFEYPEEEKAKIEAMLGGSLTTEETQKLEQTLVTILQSKEYTQLTKTKSLKATLRGFMKVVSMMRWAYYNVCAYTLEQKKRILQEVDNVNSLVYQNRIRNLNTVNMKAFNAISNELMLLADKNISGRQEDYVDWCAKVARRIIAANLWVDKNKGIVEWQHINNFAMAVLPEVFHVYIYNLLRTYEDGKYVPFETQDKFNFVNIKFFDKDIEEGLELTVNLIDGVLYDEDGTPIGYVADGTRIHGKVILRNIEGNFYVCQDILNVLQLTEPDEKVRCFEIRHNDFVGRTVSLDAKKVIAAIQGKRISLNLRNHEGVYTIDSEKGIAVRIGQMKRPSYTVTQDANFDSNSNVGRNDMVALTAWNNLFGYHDGKFYAVEGDCTMAVISETSYMETIRDNYGREVGTEKQTVDRIFCIVENFEVKDIPVQDKSYYFGNRNTYDDSLNVTCKSNSRRKQQQEQQQEQEQQHEKKSDSNPCVDYYTTMFEQQQKEQQESSSDNNSGNRSRSRSASSYTRTRRTSRKLQ